MQREIIRRTLLLSLISILIVYFFSIFTSSYYNRKALETDLVNNTLIVAEIINNTEEAAHKYDIINNFTQGRLIELELADQNYQIFKSTYRQAILSSADKLNSDDLNLINKKRSRPYLVDDQIYYTVILDNGCYLKTSMKIENDASIILMASLWLLIVLFVVIYGLVQMAKATSKKIMESFWIVLYHLETINEGNYEPIDTTHDFIEVSSILKQIDVINNKIVNNLQDINEEKDKLDFIINNINEGLLVLNEKEEIILINNYFSRLMNLQNIPVINQKLKSTYLLDNNELYQRFKMGLGFDHDSRFDFIHPKTKKIYQFSLSQIKTNWQNVNSFFFVVVTDVTIIREQDRIKSEFISNASHELKTPITAIVGFSELLAGDEEITQEQKQYVDIIYSQSQKMSNIITELLVLSRFDNLIEKKDFNFISIAESIKLQVSDLKVLAKESNVEVILEIDDFRVYASEIFLDQIFKNLIENAIKYNKPNGKVIIKSRSDDKYYYIDIIDSGIGITESDLEYIFDRFYRVDKSRTNKTGGTGLGLSIVKRCAAAIDADIKVTSEIGVGSTFTVIFNK